MERNQERALRAVFKSKWETYSELSANKSTSTKSVLTRLHNIALFMYEVKNGFVPTYMTEIFKLGNWGPIRNRKIAKTRKKFGLKPKKEIKTLNVKVLVVFRILSFCYLSFMRLNMRLRHLV